MTNNSAQGRVISPPNNAAWRCSQYLKSLTPYRGQDVGSAFGNSFQIPEFDKSNPDHLEVLRMGIAQFRRQTNLIVTALQDDDSLMPELYDPIKSVLGSINAISNLEAPLSNYSALTDPQSSIAFGWAATYLPVSAEYVSYEEISNLLNDVLSLKARLASMELPPTVLSFVDQLLQTLEREIIAAKFAGATSLRRAYRHATDELNEVARDVSEEAASLSPAQRDYLGEAANTVEKIGKISGGITATIEFARQVAKLITGG